jgi:hypothetical protein
MSNTNFGTAVTPFCNKLPKHAKEKCLAVADKVTRSPQHDTYACPNKNLRAKW